jgi:hypothetical protein
MKNTLIATAAVLGLAMGSASAFAAQQNNHGSAASQETTAQHDSSLSSSTECDNILNNRGAYSHDKVASCRHEVR